jgi:hypothetical protein
MRQEVTDEVAAAAGNDFSPCTRVGGEGIELERIDFVTNEDGDGHVTAHAN